MPMLTLKSQTIYRYCKTESIGQDVLKSVNPSQMMVKIVHDELVELMGGDKTDINIKVILRLF